MTKWLIIGGTYLALIAAHGYRFGDEDMSETLSYALYMNDHSLYPRDLYIQAVGPDKLNERFPFTMVLAVFDNRLEWPSFFLHLLSSLLLITGLWTISRTYIRENLWQLLFLLASLILLYNLNLGGNEIWYHYFVPSHLAKAIGIWGLVCWLREKVLGAYLLAALATFAQPVVGAQLALIFLLLDMMRVLKRETEFKTAIMGPLVYALTAGVWIISIFASHLIADHSISNRAFYEIMETRLGHHFFPSYYPLKSWLLLIPLFITGCIIWRKIDIQIFRLFLVSFVGMLLYVLGIEVFEIPSLLSVQWFKVTVWLKPLSVLACFVVLDKLIKEVPKYASQTLLIFLVIFSGLQIFGLARFLPEKPYYFPWSDYHTPDMQLALKLHSILPNDVCIIAPPNITGIRYFSQRSLYVDYKSNIHSKTYMAEVADRRLALYNMNLTDRRAGKDIVAEGRLFYQQLREHDFEKYKSNGATHVITEDTQKLDLPIVTQNELYTVYKL